ERLLFQARRGHPMILLAMGLFFVLILLGLDIGFSMILAAIVGMLSKTAEQIDLVQVPLAILGGVDSAALLTIPLFILAGELMNRGGVTRRLIEWSLAFVGHFRGSLSQVSVMTNFML